MGTINAVEYPPSTQWEELLDSYEPYNIAEEPYAEVDTEPLVVNSLGTAINSFRLPGDSFYRELRGSERVMPAVELQVRHAEQHLCGWVGELIRDTVDGNVGRRSSNLADVTAQVEDLHTLSTVTSGRYAYWERNYKQDDSNPAGHFVRWMSRRSTLPLIAQARQRILAQQGAMKDTLFSQVRPDFSVIAHYPDVRRTAYQARMDAKVGLAVMRVMTPQRSRFLFNVCLPMAKRISEDEADPLRDTPDLVGMFTSAEQLITGLKLPWSEPATSLEELPF